MEMMSLHSFKSSVLPPNTFISVLKLKEKKSKFDQMLVSSILFLFFLCWLGSCPYHFLVLLYKNENLQYTLVLTAAITPHRGLIILF